MKGVTRRKGGPLGVVNGTPWGGPSEPLRWCVVAFGVVDRSPWGGASEPVGWFVGPRRVVRRSLRGG